MVERRSFLVGMLLAPFAAFLAWFHKPEGLAALEGEAVGWVKNEPEGEYGKGPGDVALAYQRAFNREMIAHMNQRQSALRVNHLGRVVTASGNKVHFSAKI